MSLDGEQPVERLQGRRCFNYNCFQYLETLEEKKFRLHTPSQKPLELELPNRTQCQWLGGQLLVYLDSWSSKKSLSVAVKNSEQVLSSTPISHFPKVERVGPFLVTSPFPQMLDVSMLTLPGLTLRH